MMGEASEVVYDVDSYTMERYTMMNQMMREVSEDVYDTESSVTLNSDSESEMDV